jgi:LysR family glycine cleavage system transcriptional activator
MPRRPPPLSFVRSFESAARHLSFTKAAEEIGCTQASVSMHVRSLEQLLGVDLFLRFPRSLKLTDAGEAYLPSLRQALLMIDAATQTVQISRTYKTVVVSAPMSLAENWLAARIAAFQDQHPDVDIVIKGKVWSEPDDDDDTNVHIDMCRHDAAPADARLLRRGELALLCAPRNQRDITAPTDVMHLQKIVILGRQDYWLDYAKALQVPRLDMTRALRTNASNVALELVAHGAGVTVLPMDLARPYLDRNLLAVPLEHRAPSAWGYYVRESQTNYLAASQSLVRWLLASD